MPDDCPFGILHALDVGEIGLVSQPRRWGKTRRLKEIVERMHAAGKPVLIIGMGPAVREQFRGYPGQILTYEEAMAGLGRGLAAAVFTDELDKDEVENAMKALSSGCRFVLGYHTPKHPD